MIPGFFRCSRLGYLSLKPPSVFGWNIHRWCFTGCLGRVESSPTLRYLCGEKHSASILKCGKMQQCLNPTVSTVISLEQETDKTVRIHSGLYIAAVSDRLTAFLQSTCSSPHLLLRPAHMNWCYDRSIFKSQQMNMFDQIFVSNMYIYIHIH